MFCWAVVLVAGVEQWLMVVQLHRGTGIFGCHKYSVFSDEKLSLGDGPYGWGVVEATPIPGPGAFSAPVPGTGEMVWHNTNVFARAYDRIQQDGFYKDYDWSIKVDPDTAFIPGVLQRKLAQRSVDVKNTPVYFVNCQMYHSLQGPLEVLSLKAGKVFYSGYRSCMDKLNWKDWGEDWFINKCLDQLGVQGWDGYDMLNDMWCKDQWSDSSGYTYGEEYRQHGPSCRDGKSGFHPYKTTKELALCLDQADPLNIPQGL